jgi:hypothetical protein
MKFVWLEPCVDVNIYSNIFTVYKHTLPVRLGYGFNFHGFVHCNNYSDIYPTRCNFTQLILSGNCSTCFGWCLYPSPGARTTVSTASGISHTVTVICHYCGRVGTGLSVLWTLKPVPTLPRQRQITVTVWLIQDAVDTVVRASGDGWRYHPKHVEQFPDKISCILLDIY